MNIITKTTAESLTVMTEMVLSSHVNGSGRLFGGQLMSWMDVAGAICAKRHSGCEVVTAKADGLAFIKPAIPNDVIVLTAKLMWVGNTSMKVRITAEVETYHDGGGKQLICSACFVYVAFGKDGKKQAVPRLIPANESDRAEIEAFCSVSN